MNSKKRERNTYFTIDFQEHFEFSRKGIGNLVFKLEQTKIDMAKVGIIMGSISDLPIMQEAANILKEFNIAFEMNIVSAHRTPDLMVDYARNAHKRGVNVIIAGAGGAAHLPGMTASLTALPVIGVPIKSSNSLDGWDSILSILQMPNGIPVATVALNGAKNAGILAVKIIGASNDQVQGQLLEYMEDMKEAVMKSAEDLNDNNRNLDV